jgi:acetolactate synthase-1/2/3 large subunit
MNGAESLVRTLLAGGVDVCFTNPGTSEMHFVAALDKNPGMRCVLGLFEGVVTGAADGYYRMADRPASTLLHLGPGLANGLANLHNARKAQSGVVNIVGDHAAYHLQYNAPLTSDIEGLAAPVSHWIRTSSSSGTVAADGAMAIEAARRPPGQVATLILPADTAWGDGGEVAVPCQPPERPGPDAGMVKKAAEVLRNGKPATLLLGGAALRSGALELAGRIAAKTGCGILAESANARHERGAGRVAVHRIPYLVDRALAVLRKAGQLVLVGSTEPVAFFAYPDKPSVLVPEAIPVVELAPVEADLEASLQSLAEELGAQSTEAVGVSSAIRPEVMSGAITPESIATVLGACIPEGAIVVDESVTTGWEFFAMTSGAPPHDWINNRGGSIGYGLPVALGAAMACPDRKVIALASDGSSMYTLQALWTMARENLDITILVFSNRSYNILHGELRNVGVTDPGQAAMDMLSLDRPDLDWVAMARGMGVPAVRVTESEELTRVFRAGLTGGEPNLIELVM